MITSENEMQMFSENEMLILSKIAISSDSVTAYDLSITLGRDYSTIHKTCKKLIGAGVLEPSTETNDKNAPKKILRFTLWGFCLFIRETILFFLDAHLTTQQQVQVLKNWNYLHESLGWIYSFVVKVPDEREREDILYRFDFWVCRDIIDLGLSRAFDGTKCIWRQRTIPEIFELIDSQLYNVVLEELFFWFILSRGTTKLAPIPLDEMVGIIKKSEKGESIIKSYVYGKFNECKALKKIDELL
jgi:hypothetical protein